MSTTSGSVPSRPYKRARYATPQLRREVFLGDVEGRGSSTPRRQSSPPATSSNVDDQDLDADSEDDSSHEIIMALNAKDRGTVGCAYYVAREEKLYCMQDAKMGGKDVVESLRTFIAPTLLLLPFNLDEHLIDILEGQPQSQPEIDVAGQARSIPCQLEFRVAADWKYEQGRDKLMNIHNAAVSEHGISLVAAGEGPDMDDLEVPDDSFSAGRIKRLLHLSSTIDVDSRISVGCAGAVLGCIQRRRNAAYCHSEELNQSLFHISKVQSFSLGGYMSINLDTLLSLQVIHAEAHPSSHNRGPQHSGSKEGLSLYGMFHKLARTQQGKTLLRQYFLRPLLKLGEIEQRHATISVLTRPVNLPSTDKLISHLKKIKNMHGTIINLRKGSSGGIMGARRAIGGSRTIWSSIRMFIYHSLQIKFTLLDMTIDGRVDIFDKVMRTFEERSLAEAGDAISRTIDDELSLHQQRTVVKQGVDAELDALQRFNGGLENLLDHVAQAISRTIPMLLNAQLSVVFYPQMGFLVAVRRTSDGPRGVYEGDENNPWEKHFHTQDYVYYKTSEVREMDEKFGDTWSQICDREIEIIQKLTEHILQYEDLLLGVSDTCGELDCLVALAQGAREFKLVRPQMTEENAIHIEGGRHLLQEQTVPDFIVNDTYLRGGGGADADVDDEDLFGRASPVLTQSTCANPSMIMVTGPNYSGKSVYLKQVALITILAHIGSFIPANKATVGLTDKILSRIGTRESVSRVQSAFMIDLQQISSALEGATRRSLIIIDEFGKGTDSYDGAGLAAAMFDNLLSRGDERPKVVAATHMHEILDSGCLASRPNLSLMNMQVHLASNEQHKTSAGSSIVYLYQLTPGRSSSSYGTVCAAMNGVSASIVEHAENLIDMAAKGEDLVAACAAISSEEEDDLRAAENVARRFLGCDFETDVRAELGLMLDRQVSL